MGLTRPKLAQVATTTAAFNDAVIVLNNNASSGDNNTKDIGIVFERGADTNQILLWDESQDRFILASSTEQGATQGDVTISGYADLQVGALTASSISGISNISSITVNSAYTLPTVDGNAGYVLTTDGSGTVTWEVGGGEASGHEIQNNSVALTTRTALNFDGTYLVATDDAVNDQNDVTVSSNLQTWHSTTNNASNWDTAYGWGNHASQGYITNLAGLSITATAAELNTLDGITATTTELNYTDGVTSNIQTQLNSKISGNQTITLSGDASGSGTTAITVTVADDSHTHAFNNLTSKTSGTGDYATTGDLVSGKGSGGVALTINDGYGNANVTWNHQDGKPEQNGNAARIEVNTDSTSNASMYFELKSNVSNGVAVGLTNIMTLTESAITAGSGVVFSGTATSARYADLAEKYMPDAEYTAGTVLQFGGNKEVTLADEYATRRVAGVVSTNPAFMMNEQLDGGVYIALTGCVPCRAIGIVNPGDLMVASNTAGVAAARDDPLRDPPAGSIIGKAIRGKALSAEELIEVVVGVR